MFGKIQDRAYVESGVCASADFHRGAMILKAAVEVSAEAHFGGSTVDVLNKRPYLKERGNRSDFTCRVNDSNCGAVATHPNEVLDIEQVINGRAFGSIIATAAFRMIHFGSDQNIFRDLPLHDHGVANELLQRSKTERWWTERSCPQARP